jgi:DNA modification methylase
LARRCVRLSTWPDEVVLDPFAGWGTTLLAARQLGRRAIGGEPSERYCELAARRLAEFNRQLLGYIGRLSRPVRNPSRQLA